MIKFLPGELVVLKREFGPSVRAFASTEIIDRDLRGRFLSGDLAVVISAKKSSLNELWLNVFTESGVVGWIPAFKLAKA